MTATHQTLPCRLCTNTLLPSTARRTGGLCLDCFHREKQRLATDARESAPGCPACDGSGAAPAVSFDWQPAVQGRGAFAKYPKYLRPLGPAKDGARHACVVCAASWYLARGRTTSRMMRIPPECVPQFDAWCATRIECAGPILDAARRIGATPPDFDADFDDVRIPCRVGTRQGEHIDLAVLRISRLPPVPWQDDSPDRLPRFRLASDIRSIEASRLALPRSVRRAFALTRSPPVDRDWLYVDVRSRANRRYRLSGAPMFFDRDGTPGSALRLAYRSGGTTVPSRPHGPLTVFAADWFDGAELLQIAAGPIEGFFAWLRWQMRGRAA